MTIEHSIRLMAGIMIATSLTLYYLVSPYWLFLAAFVSLNLIQSSLSKFCPAEIIMGKLFFKGANGSCCQPAKDDTIS